ncbi:hypothetical protein [Hymenobacter aerophilus]|uniref:hypothetical protein n=1 Tax=Hymenobacter aerophilus TaxID=119644 RepID=UPI00036E7C5D|nr:hypothetical protein [Hymenobacter aerophilus]
MQNKAPIASRHSMLVQLLVLLPVGCLLVPVHFSPDGADAYADKRLLFIYGLLPALLYYAAPYLYPDNQRKSLVAAVTLFMSFVISMSMLTA